MRRIIEPPAVVVRKASSASFGPPAREVRTHTPVAPPRREDPPPPPPPSAKEVLKAEKRARRKAEIAARLAAMSPEDRAREEAKIARDVKLTAMTAPQRVKYLARERKREEEARAHLHWGASWLTPEQTATWEAWARARFAYKLSCNPAVADRYDRTRAMTEEEVLAVIGTVPEAVEAWHSGTIGRFIALCWNHAPLPEGRERELLDRMVTAREVRDGVNDPPWMIFAMVRKKTCRKHDMLKVSPA